MRNCVRVARQTLTLFVWVQILVPQPLKPASFKKSVSHTLRGVAQFGGALRSGRRGRWFESSHLDQTVTKLSIWGYSSAGRAPALQAGGHRFEPCCPHQKRNTICLPDKWCFFSTKSVLADGINPTLVG